VASWNPSAETFADNKTIGEELYSIFINTNNTVYVPAQTYNSIIIWHNASLPQENIAFDNLFYPLSVFVTFEDDIYVYGIYENHNEDNIYRNHPSSYVEKRSSGDIRLFPPRPKCKVCPKWKREPRCCKKNPPTNPGIQVNSNITTGQQSSNSSQNQEHIYGSVYKRSLMNTTSSVVIMNVSESCFSIFVDINNTIYCSMEDHHQVVKKSLNRYLDNLTIVAGNGCNGSASNMLNYPCGIFIDINFDLYVADSFNHRIQLFSLGNLSGETLVGNATLLYPTGVILDVDQSLFIVDSGNHRIIVWRSGSFQCLVGCSTENGSASNQLFSPTTLSFDSYGNMFVVDTGNDRIQKFLLARNSCGGYRLRMSLRCLESALYHLRKHYNT
jgi:hypothetical protein